MMDLVKQAMEKKLLRKVEESNKQMELLRKERQEQWRKYREERDKKTVVVEET